MSFKKWKNRKLKQIYGIDIIYHIHDFVQAFPYVKQWLTKSGFTAS